MNPYKHGQSAVRAKIERLDGEPFDKKSSDKPPTKAERTIQPGETAEVRANATLRELICMTSTIARLLRGHEFPVKDRFVSNKTPFIVLDIRSVKDQFPFSYQKDHWQVYESAVHRVH